MFDLSTDAPLITRRLRGAISGLQAGVVGGLAMIVFMTVVSLLERGPWWAYPNLLATMFYGGHWLAIGPGWPTIVGSAVQVLSAGVAGGVFGAIFGETTGGSRSLVLGIIWGLGWYYFSDWVYRTQARWISVYAPELPLLMAHLLLGLVLGTAGRIRGAAQIGGRIG